MAQPPDYVLVVEEEEGLREIIRREVEEKLGCQVKGCTPKEFAESPDLLVGAQVFAPGHLIEGLKWRIPHERPAISITYRSVEKYVDLIRELRKPSVVATVSISESALRTARGLFASAIGRRHTLREILVKGTERLKLSGVDLAFCDSVTMVATAGRNKVQYRLVGESCLEHLAAVITPSALG